MKHSAEVVSYGEGSLAFLVVLGQEVGPDHGSERLDRELKIIRSQSLATSYPAAVEDITSLPDLAERIVTHTFGLAEYAEALASASSESARKVHIFPQR